MSLTIGSLFSGYGGLDRAAERFFNAETKWFCEYDEAPSRILAHHWPHVHNFGDVTKIDWANIGTVDIITGGYPCQPFSLSGQRKGADDERHLWPYVREAIRQLRPRYAVLENVKGHRSLGFDRVLGDLAEDGLHARWISLRASHAGAPHHRERLFIVATPANSEGFGWYEGLRSRRVQEAKSGVGFSEDVLPRWEGVAGPAPAFTDDRGKLNARYAEWMMGLPAGWVTSNAIGLSYRDQLKAIGNGVCPPQAELALSLLIGQDQV